eukprot:g15414.t1
MTARETNHGKKSGRTQIEPENIYVSSTEKCPAVSPASTTTAFFLRSQTSWAGCLAETLPRSLFSASLYPLVSMRRQAPSAVSPNQETATATSYQRCCTT